MRYNFRVLKRNPTLLFIPTMYYIAKGRRIYVGEVYGKVSFKDVDKFSMKQQVSVSTIPYKRRVMNTMVQYITPNIYGETMFRNNVLSPFHRYNRRYYRYRISINTQGQTCVTFTPVMKNTQLITGYAIVDRTMGRVVRTRFRGEKDMIEFAVNLNMGKNSNDNSLIPKECEARASFSFMGNKIRTEYKAFYNCDTTLPDSISDSTDYHLIEQLRPDDLTHIEKEAYNAYRFESQKKNSVLENNTNKRNALKEKTWDFIGDKLLNSLGMETAHTSIKISPLINPFYFSYSHGRGLSYKLNIGVEYKFSEKQNLSFSPNLGYNFKIKQFYFTAPLRYTYDSRHRGWLELTWANGNRITNSSILDIIRNERRDTINFSSLELDYFKDERFQLTWNTLLSRRLNIEFGSIYHIRRAVNSAAMRELNKMAEYKTMAPYITLTWTPSEHWPIFTGNYERSIRGFLQSNTEYEKWEFDASLKKTLPGLRRYNLRLGGGFFTNRSEDFFVDYKNFHENYLPGGWEDDWSGEFQLLNSEWYNSSQYYVRANASYESPLLILTWLPWVGKYIEKERLYLSTLQIENSRPYFELGYGLTNRFFSMGIFGSFLNGQMYDLGCKFTLELFEKW